MLIHTWNICKPFKRAEEDPAGAVLPAGFLGLHWLIVCFQAPGNVLQWEKRGPVRGGLLTGGIYGYR